MRMLSKTRGFTLMELLIAIAVVGILAAIVMPSYSSYVRRGKTQEATAALADGRVKLEQFYQDNQTYAGYVNASCVPLTAGVTSFVAGTKYFTYTCASAAASFTITADGSSAEGMNGYQYIINQDNAKSSTVPGDSSTDRWITKAGE